jgi:hypothetical protein
MSGGAKLNVRHRGRGGCGQRPDQTLPLCLTGGGSPLPAFSGGAHTVVEMDDHGTRRLNPYSLMSDPEDGSGYDDLGAPR